MARVINKTLYAKRVRFKSGRLKNFTPEPIEDLLRNILQVAPSWARRHWPLPPQAPAAIPPWTVCSFVSRITDREDGDQKGVYFEVGTYVNGHAPDQMALDFQASEPDITTDRVRDAGGNEREIVTICRCVALGETIIVENVRGSGGVLAVQRLLSKLLQVYCVFGPNSQRYPSIELIDVMSGDLRDAIRQGGGAEKISLRLVEGAEPAPDAWLRPLKAGRDRFRNTAVFAATWEAADCEALNTDDVVAAAAEREALESDLDSVVIHLKDGNRITNLGKYKSRYEVSMKVNDGELPQYNIVVAGLWSYLDQLRRAKDSWRLLDDHGNFTTSKPVDLAGKA